MMISYIIEIFHGNDSPAMVRLTDGSIAPWLRYCGWLLTSPVILIALSGTGMPAGVYSRRTMKLLTSDQGFKVMQITSAFSKGSVKVAFFFVAMVYGGNTLYSCATVYLQAFANIHPELQGMIKFMSAVFFAAFIMYPILFVAGPEGFGHVSPEGSIIGHAMADLLSKSLWGVCSWWLACQVKALSEDDEDETSEDGSEESDRASELPAVPRHTSNVILGDPQGTLVPYYTQAFTKLPAALTVVDSMESLLDELEEMKDAGHRVDMCLVAPTLLEHGEFNRLRSEYSGVKIVVYVEGLANIPEESLAPFRERCDDFIEAPARGVMVDESELTQVFYRHAESLVGPAAPIEAHLAAQTAILLTIKADIARMQRGDAPPMYEGKSKIAAS